MQAKLGTNVYTLASMAVKPGTNVYMLAANIHVNVSPQLIKRLNQRLHVSHIHEPNMKASSCISHLTSTNTTKITCIHHSQLCELNARARMINTTRAHTHLKRYKRNSRIHVTRPPSTQVNPHKHEKNPTLVHVSQDHQK